jgi:DNA polymerase I-like protein with 3'-5' exonuclease and polymerase domains
MSWVIYSKKPIDKAMWANNFYPYMDTTDYKDKVREYSNIVYKTEAVKCMVCKGDGYIRKVKKDGSLYSKPNRCSNCNTSGYLFNSTRVVAGLKFSAPNAKWISANGFTTNKAYLDILRNVAKKNNLTDAVQFLTDLQRLSALDTYLSSFVEGISTHVKSDGKLHVRLLQHRTATGRFSGADPNMQNMPRGGTFPVKKVFVSRWEGGKILEADFAQLEFRTAAYLSQDEIAIKEIKDGFDVHSYTASVISDAGEKTSRQEAKAHTFAPLYGATGFGRTPSQATYYKHFTDKYKGVSLWHSKLAKEALETNMITTPSGRQFSFPDVERRSNGSVSYFTQIKNYPVQSFATADIVPLVLIEIDKALDKYSSCVVNTVHDSIVIDIHPHEREDVLNIIRNVNKKLNTLINMTFKIDFNVPLLLEAKIGDNWLDTKDVS